MYREDEKKEYIRHEIAQAMFRVSVYNYFCNLVDVGERHAVDCKAWCPFVSLDLEGLHACASVRVRARARDLVLVFAQVRRRVVSLHVKTLKVVKYYRNNKQ